MERNYNMKFKHKKLNIIAEKLKHSELYEFSYDSYDSCYMPKEFFENSNDWQEVKPKEWEITALIYDNRIYQYLKDNKYFTDKDCTGGWVILDPKEKDSRYIVHIYSVKRISDNVEFKIGDKLELLHDIVEIKEFHVVNTCISIKISSEISSGNIALQALKHAKKALFKTEDGVEIFEGERYYFVNKGEQDWIVKHSADRDYPNRYVNFSTKEVAEQYIIENKPCLSYNEVKTLFSQSSTGEGGLSSYGRDKLQQLIKTKLKL